MSRVVCFWCVVIGVIMVVMCVIVGIAVVFCVCRGGFVLLGWLVVVVLSVML